MEEEGSGGAGSAAGGGSVERDLRLDLIPMEPRGSAIANSVVSAGLVREDLISPTILKKGNCQLFSRKETAVNSNGSQERKNPAAMILKKGKYRRQ